jgi:hypothetical protein
MNLAGTPVSNELVAREATPEELDDWDRGTVVPSSGNVLQSRAWAVHRSRFGWMPVFLVTHDGCRVLGLRRTGGLLRPDRLYLSRGPIPKLAQETALHAQACATWASEHGIGTVVADSEIMAATGYSEFLRAFGWRQTEEIQPSRHRMTIDLRGIGDPEELLRAFGADTRGRLRGALRSDLEVRVDGLVDRSKDPQDPTGPDGREARPGEARIDLPRGLRERLAQHHALVAATGARKGFAVAPGERFLDWSILAYEAGYQVFIGVHTPDGALVASSTFYRHGNRWTYALAADDPGFRHAYPGAVRRVLWEGIVRALEEGRDEMDLGGVDVPGARRRPEPGEAEHGMLAFKESFAARWVELAGAHRIVLPAARRGLPGLLRLLPRPLATRLGAD